MTVHLYQVDTFALYVAIKKVAGRRLLLLLRPHHILMHSAWLLT